MGMSSAIHSLTVRQGNEVATTLLLFVVRRLGLAMFKPCTKFVSTQYNNEFALRLAGQTSDNFALMSAHDN